MSIAQEIRTKVGGLRPGLVFSASDIATSAWTMASVVKTLNRLAQSGEIEKLSKGKFYKPLKTRFGVLRPTTEQVAKDFIEKNGKLVGYTTGSSAYNDLGLTTQVSSTIQIGANKYRHPIQRGGYTIEFIVQRNPITHKNINVLRILDAMRFFREIPATSPDDACRRLREIVNGLSASEKAKLASCAMSYTNYVRAICGAILEDVGCDDSLTLAIRKSLNGITEYRLPISDSALPTKRNWRIV